MPKFVKVGLAAFFSLMVALAVVGSIVLFSDEASADTGVSACSEMKKNAESGKKSSSNSKMTETQRDEKLAPFKNSQFSDIRVAGTNLVTTLYQADQKEDGNLGEALDLLTTVRTQYTALQIACSNHGVDLPPLPSAS